MNLRPKAHLLKWQLRLSGQHGSVSAIGVFRAWEYWVEPVRRMDLSFELWRRGLRFARECLTA
jgi:hypothetical protein